jgi:hypothetical protein
METLPEQVKEYKEGETMTGAQYTPGPWDTVKRNVTARKGVFIGTDTKPIAEICFLYGDESEANLRLICQAPEMFEALVEARQALFGDPDYEDPVVISPEYAEFRDKIDKIIAKVKGE